MFTWLINDMWGPGDEYRVGAERFLQTQKSNSYFFLLFIFNMTLTRSFNLVSPCVKLGKWYPPKKLLETEISHMEMIGELNTLNKGSISRAKVNQGIKCNA